MSEDRSTRTDIERLLREFTGSPAELGEVRDLLKGIAESEAQRSQIVAGLTTVIEQQTRLMSEMSQSFAQVDQALNGDASTAGVFEQVRLHQKELLDLRSELEAYGGSVNGAIERLQALELKNAKTDVMTSIVDGALKATVLGIVAFILKMIASGMFSGGS
jgi:hypothetical protein